MALRKLQSEIDKTLKTVQQGLETFENLYEKLSMSNSATQKDKIETDLKTQIKKLQRMRDQIKEWLRNNDIKDKSALLENRKQIESQMERFKALEKEMKMKAFSKEGLIAQSKLDPAEKAKREIIDWIGNMTDELSRQIEQTEAEAEALQATGGKKKKSQGDRLGELETLIENRQWHIGRLEVVQRMLENGQLSTEQVDSITEDVKYFVEANSEEDFEFDNGIYDDLNLQEEDEFQEFGHNDDGSNLDSASVADVLESTPAPKTPAKEDPPPPKKVTPAIKTQLPPTEDQPPSPVSAKKQPSRKSTMDSTKAELPKNLKPEPVPPVPPIPAVATPTSVPQSKPVALPPIRYAAAAAAAVASSPAPAPTVPSVPAPSQPPVEPETTAPSQTQASPTLASPQAAPPAEKPPAEVVTSPAGTSPSPSKDIPQTNGHVLPPPGIPSAVSPAPPPGTQPPPMLAQNTNGSAAPQLPNFPPPGYSSHADSSRSAGGAVSPHPQQGVLGNLMQSFDLAKEMSERRGNDVGQLHSALEVSYNNAPHQLDAEPPRYYHPRNPVKTPSHYPQSRGGLMEDKKLFQRLELDQLFFIFYYYPGTYEQWLAAESLKQANWRFHKQYLTWFKRAHNPQAITDEYEQGGYFYFDWENSWCQRKKSDFRFEYRWLSDA